MLSQLTPSANLHYGPFSSPSRTNAVNSSPKPSTTNLTTLSQTPSTNGSLSISNGQSGQSGQNGQYPNVYNNNVSTNPSQNSITPPQTQQTQQTQQTRQFNIANDPIDQNRNSPQYYHTPVQSLENPTMFDYSNPYYNRNGNNGSYPSAQSGIGGQYSSSQGPYIQPLLSSSNELTLTTSSTPTLPPLPLPQGNFAHSHSNHSTHLNGTQGGGFGQNNSQSGNFNNFGQNNFINNDNDNNNNNPNNSSRQVLNTSLPANSSTFTPSITNRSTNFQQLQHPLNTTQNSFIPLPPELQPQPSLSGHTGSFQNTPKNGQNNSEFQDDQIVERALLEDSFIEHGLLAVDKSVSILGEILNLSEGRDKLFKLFSAVLKLTRYGLNNWVEKSPLIDDILSRIKACSTATSTTRLFLKLCTDWVFFRLAARVYYQQRSGTLKIFTLTRLLGMAGYFTFQWPVWLQATGLVNNLDKSFWSKISIRCYIGSVCSQIFMDLRKAIDLTKEIGYWQLIVPGEALEQMQNELECRQNDTNCNDGKKSGKKDKKSGANSPSHDNKNNATSPHVQSSPNISTPIASRNKSNNNNNNNNSSSPQTPGTEGLKNGVKNASSMSLAKLPNSVSMDENKDVNPIYALSFQRRCTPTTARYQALLQRTIWQNQLQTEVAEAQRSHIFQPYQHNHPPQQQSGMFQSLLSLPSTLNDNIKGFTTQLMEPNGNYYITGQRYPFSPGSNLIPTSPSSPSSPQTQTTHPYLVARDQHQAFTEQLKKLQDETRLALVRENMLQKDRNKLFVNFIKDGGDLFGALDGLYDWGHSDLTLGLISLVSSSISIYRMWARYKQTVEKAMLEEARDVLVKKQEEEDEQRRIVDEREKLRVWAQQVEQYYAQLQQQQIQEHMQSYYNIMTQQSNQNSSIGGDIGDGKGGNESLGGHGLDLDLDEKLIGSNHHIDQNEHQNGKGSKNEKLNSFSTTPLRRNSFDNNIHTANNNTHGNIGVVGNGGSSSTQLQPQVTHFSTNDVILPIGSQLPPLVIEDKQQIIEKVDKDKMAQIKIAEKLNKNENKNEKNKKKSGKKNDKHDKNDVHSVSYDDGNNTHITEVQLDDMKDEIEAPTLNGASD